MERFLLTADASDEDLVLRGEEIWVRACMCDNEECTAMVRVSTQCKIHSMMGLCKCSPKDDNRHYCMINPQKLDHPQTSLINIIVSFLTTIRT